MRVSIERRSESLNWSWTALSLLTIFWALCVTIVIFAGFYQKEFFNPEMVLPFLSVVAASEFLYSMVFVFYENTRKRELIWWLLFFFNTIFVTYILISTNWNQSMFFLMYLINIVSAGLTLKTRGSYWVGIFTVIGFNFAVLVSPQTKIAGYLFSVVFNNISLLFVSYLSGQLSEYLEVLGVRLLRADRDLRDIKNLHEMILKHIPSGVLTLDQAGSLVHVNEKAREILSMELLESEVLWNEFQKELKQSSVGTHGQGEIVWTPKNQDRKILRFQMDLVEFQESKESAKVYVLDDVTHIREIEENLRNQEKLAAIGKLAAGIAHEIRNPLASISGSVQLLSSQAGTEEDKKLFNIVIRETDRLNLLISEFLDYAKPLPRPTDRLSLTALIREVLELVSFNKKLPSNVQTEIHLTEEVYILGFRDKLKQALLNIIINSYQAMDQVPQPIFILTLNRLDGDLVLIRIKDNGNGMSEETRKRIFEPFFTTKKQGTGLGLAVTYQILESHGASIIVESIQGIGTEFVIKLKEAGRIS